MKRKMKTMNNQVTRLRDEITGKELAINKEQQEHKRLEKDNEALKVSTGEVLLRVFMNRRLQFLRTTNTTVEVK